MAESYDNKYRIGVYGSSGNLGYSMPNNWAFE